MVIYMRYNHRFTVKAPLSEVAAFHQQPGSMAAITPPPVRVDMHSEAQSLSDGDELSFTLWFGPLPIHWRARIEDVSATGFSDRQVNGLFKEWVHRHSFEMLDNDTTLVRDVISIRLADGLLWKLVGLGFVLGLPVLFAYRGWRTRWLLEEGAG